MLFRAKNLMHGFIPSKHIGFFLCNNFIRICMAHLVCGSLAASDLDISSRQPIRLKNFKFHVQFLEQSRSNHMNDHGKNNVFQVQDYYCIHTLMQHNLW